MFAILRTKIEPGGFSKFISMYWKLHAQFRVFGRLGGFVMVEFEGEADNNIILQSAPWFLNGHHVILRQWEPSMELKKDLLKIIPIWVTFPHLGLHPWDRGY